MPAMTTSMPVDWVGQPMAWSPMGAQLFFIAIRDSGYELYRADMQSSADPVVVAKADEGTSYRDVFVSPEGRALAWIAVGKEQLRVEVLDLPGGRHSLPAIARDPAIAHYLAGWTSENAVLLLRTQSRGSMFDIQMTELPMSGDARAIAFVGNSPVPAVRMDPQRSRVLLTRDDEGVHNIYGVSLRDGAVTRITTNESPGVSFSGIQPLSAGAIVFAREERKRDIWVVQKKTAN